MPIRTFSFKRASLTGLLVFGAGAEGPEVLSSAILSLSAG